MSKCTKWGVFWIIVIGIIVGIAISATTISVVHWAGSDEFCTTWCHSMDGVSYAWKQGQHARMPSGYSAGCSDCHLRHESTKSIGFFTYCGLLIAKCEAGLNSLLGEITGTFSTPEKWIKNRPESSKAVIDFMTSNDFDNCRGCHDLSKMYNSQKPIVMKAHAAFVDKPTNCILCHKTAGHNYTEVDAYIQENKAFPPLADAWKEASAPAPALVPTQTSAPAPAATK